MAAAKKNTFVDIELSWAEDNLRSWKAYIDANPMEALTDRMDYKDMKNGGTMRTVVATKEAQGKYIQETMKNYLALLKEVDAMREKEELKKTSTRGDLNLGPLENGDI